MTVKEFANHLLALPAEQQERQFTVAIYTSSKANPVAYTPVGHRRSIEYVVTPNFSFGMTLNVYLPDNMHTVERKTI